nr:hypothetical protein [uncultured Oscillibacter sp.]
MEDYIEILLEALEEHDREYLGGEYFAQSGQAMEAMETLDKTFSREQKKLFQDYEEKQNAVDSTGRMALARQAFLLAKEIYR